jgi:hypothetical protein
MLIVHSFSRFQLTQMKTMRHLPPQFNRNFPRSLRSCSSHASTGHDPSGRDSGHATCGPRNSLTGDRQRLLDIIPFRPVAAPAMGKTKPCGDLGAGGATHRRVGHRCSSQTSGRSDVKRQLRLIHELLLCLSAFATPNDNAPQRTSLRSAISRSFFTPPTASSQGLDLMMSLCAYDVAVTDTAHDFSAVGRGVLSLGIRSDKRSVGRGRDKSLGSPKRGDSR